MWSRRRLGGVLTGAAVSAGLGMVRAEAVAGPTTHRIVIRKFAFVPARLEIKTGEAVEWTNDDIAPHTATGRDGSWDTGELARGESRSVAFSAPGRAAFYCRFHRRMTGEIVVADARAEVPS